MNLKKIIDNERKIRIQDSSNGKTLMSKIINSKKIYDRKDSSNSIEENSI